MPWESIGTCSSGELPDDKDWIIQCYEMALNYLEFVLGIPPTGCELGIMWHDDDQSDYPSIGIYWDYAQHDAPWDYISKCEIVLKKFDEAIEWPEIKPEYIYKEIDDEDDIDN